MIGIKTADWGRN